jgi:hypothetical protein
MVDEAKITALMHQLAERIPKIQNQEDAISVKGDWRLALSQHKELGQMQDPEDWIDQQIARLDRGHIPFSSLYASEQQPGVNRLISLLFLSTPAAFQNTLRFVEQHLNTPKRILDKILQGTKNIPGKED